MAGKETFRQECMLYVLYLSYKNKYLHPICFDIVIKTEFSKERNRLKMLLPKSKPYVAIPNLLCSSPYISRCRIRTAEINSNVRFQTAL